MGPRNLHHQHTANPYDIGPFDDDQACGDIPQFVFPRAREEDHEEEPVHPLLQAGTFGGDDDPCPTAFLIGCGDESLLAYCGDVDVENVVKHPAGLAVNH